MDRAKHYIIRPYNNHFVLVNVLGKRENHTHLKSVGTCRLLVDLVCKKVVPDSDYLRTSAIRVSRDEKYIEKVEHKISKDRGKQKFHKVNNGRWR